MNFNIFQFLTNTALQPGEVIYDTVIVKTTDLIGESSLWYEISPFTGPNPWQLEQHHFNNSYLHSFNVHEDELNRFMMSRLTEYAF